MLMMRILVGTEKGAYLLTESGPDWQVDGPMFPGWKVTAFGQTTGGAHVAATGSNWFGVGVHHSENLLDWKPSDSPPTWPEGSDRKMEQIWTFHNEGSRLLAGVAQAGLFSSDDGGMSWDPVTSLNEHQTRDQWSPGAGGLCAHRILSGDGSMWVGISAVGVFRSDDDGATWVPKNDGIPSVDTAEGGERPEVGYCVHGLANDSAEPNRMWRQDHQGVFRSTDGGDNWERIEDGLPAGFGFVMWRHPDTGRLLTVPLESSENRVPVDGKLSAFASDDDGSSWRVAGSGWSDAPQFTGVLRRAFDGDGNGAFCFGTSGGKLWLTRDLGDTWQELNASFPRIAAVSIVA
jgi:ligand-binding sensor domain-containing protein